MGRLNPGGADGGCAWPALYLGLVSSLVQVVEWPLV